MTAKSGARSGRFLQAVGTLLMGGVLAAQSGGSRPASLEAPTGPIDDARYVRAPLAPEDQGYARITGERMKTWMSGLISISRKSRDDGNRYWGRIAGTKYENLTNDWVEARFRELGLQELKRLTFDLRPQWFVENWDFTVEAQGKSHTFTSALPALQSPATPANGLSLQAVWVGMGSAADFAGRDVRGKAVFIQDVPSEAGNHSADWSGASKRAQALGASAIVLVYGLTDNWAAWERLGQEVMLPGFMVGHQDGSAIRDLIAAGPVTVRLKSDARLVQGLKSQSVWGTLPGRSSENIIIMAHNDAYFDGALDNASGVAVMLALAEHFAKVPQEQRARSIVFIGAPAHHAGSPNAQWLHDHRVEQLTRTALMINCEHASSTLTYRFRDQTLKANGGSALRFWTSGSPRLADVVAQAYRAFGIPTYPDMMRGAGEMGAAKLDAPSIQILRSPEDKHTDNDIMDWVPAAGLEATARAYAKIIDEVNKLDLRDLRADTSSAR